MSARPLLFAALAACAGGGPEPAAPSRTASVAASKATDKAVEGFCEVVATEATAKPFLMPPLAEEGPPVGNGWRWVNVWATWCGPCVAEMPMVLKWRDRLKEQGHPTELVLLSVDDKPELLAPYYAKHPDQPKGPRAQGAAVLPAWLESNGLDPGAAIPLHFFVDPEGRTRCVRTGAIDPGDFEVVKKIVGG
jgi:thiol-disulfide isomerase/thioredoxin